MIPSWALGPSSLPRFLLPLTETMARMITDQGRQKARLAQQELLSSAEHYETRCKNTIDIIRQQYAAESDPHSNKAVRLLKQTVDHYKGSEKLKLKSIYDREVRKQPHSNIELGELVSKPLPVNATNTDATDSRQSRSKKKSQPQSPRTRSTTPTNKRAESKSPRRQANIQPRQPSQQK